MNIWQKQSRDLIHLPSAIVRFLPKGRVPMPVLQIRLLGDFCLSFGDHPVTGFDSRRLQELLAFLVLHRGSPQSRQRLAFLLWPDSAEAQSRTNLRNLFHRLRAALPDSHRFLAADANSLLWKADSPFTLDVLTFEDALAQSTTVEDLRQAVRLYGGDLLPGQYDDWVLSERERLRQELIGALQRLIDQLTQQRDYPAAIGYAQELLRSDPLREQTYRLLMRLSALNGDRAGVARFFHTCRAVLKRELGVEPSAETGAAHVQYLNQAAAPSHTPAPAYPRSHNLPLVLSRFVGREDEMRALEHLILQNRLLTLTGPAGVGKTRLALSLAEHVLDQFPDGVWLVDLAPLTDPSHLAPALASALGVREMPGMPPMDTISSRLAGRQQLIVLDNCEHMVQAVQSLIETCLRAAPELRVLVTSREPLGLDGEQVWRVQPLPVPDAVPLQDRAAKRMPEDDPGKDPAQRLLECPSVQLFVDRATTVLPSFAMTNDNAPAVAQICRRLDGIPLAVELAAGRVNIMTIQEIETRLDDAVNLLGGGKPRSVLHHRTIRAALDWSYETLSEKEQRLFRRLAVFPGGFTVEAAEQVASDPQLPLSDVLDLLSSLTDKSLVTMQAQDGETRGRLLEAVRQYARERLLAAGEAEQVQARHLHYFQRLAEELDLKTWGAEQAFGLKRLEQEHDNFRAALTWSAQAEAARGLALAASLRSLWEWQGHSTEGRVWLQKLLTLNDAAAPALRARALFAAAGVAFMQCDMPAARSLFESSLELYRELGDAPAIADCLTRLGVIVAGSCDMAAARGLFEESLALAKGLKDAGRMVFAMIYLGFVVYELDERVRGREMLEEALRLCSEWQAHAFTGLALFFLGRMARSEGDYAQARSRLVESLTVNAKAKITLGVLHAVEALGILDAFEGHFDRAARLFGAAARITREEGSARPPFEQADYDHAADKARAALGEESLASAWAEGNAMSREQAIEYATGQDA